jgi:hypothetical protein
VALEQAEAGAGRDDAAAPGRAPDDGGDGTGSVSSAAGSSGGTA